MIPFLRLIMLKIEPYDDDINADPAVAFATDAEVKMADQLRRKLEERYLTPSAPSPVSPLWSNISD